MRESVERPQLFAGADVVAVLLGNLAARLVQLRADVPLAGPVEVGADQQQVLIDGGRAVIRHREFAPRLPCRSPDPPCRCFAFSAIILRAVVKMMRGGLLRSPGQ